MSSLNKVQLIGNMTADAEIKETPSGAKVANFSLATNRSWKDAAGVKQDQTEYHNIVVWGNLVGIVEQYTSKGKKIYIEGRLQTRSWDDATGVKRYKTEVSAENLILLGAPGESGGSSYSGGSGGDTYSQVDAAPAAKSRKVVAKSEDDVSIEDIPF